MESAAGDGAGATTDRGTVMPPAAVANRVEGFADLSGDAASPRSSRRALLTWAAITGGLFLGAGTIRVLNGASSQSDDLVANPPFPLADIPKSLDGWTYVPGSEKYLDPVTTRITGAAGHITRNYYDEQTGTALNVLVLYGPAEPVLPHTPQVCYPASGYKSLASPVDRTIQVDDRFSAVFRAALFGKSGGRTALRQSVYHSYLLDGVWSPSVGDLSLPRRRAGLFKVQIQRRVLDGERTDGDEPIESFLRHLLPTLERMVAEAAARPSTAAKSAAALKPTTSVHPVQP